MSGSSSSGTGGGGLGGVPAAGNYYNADSSIHQQLLRDPDEAEAVAEHAQQEEEALRSEAAAAALLLQQQLLASADDESLPAASDGSMPAHAVSGENAAANASALNVGESGSGGAVGGVPGRGNTPSPSPQLSRSSSHHSNSSISFSGGGPSGGGSIPPLSFAGLSGVSSGPLSATAGSQAAAIAAGGVGGAGQPIGGLPRSRRCILGVCAMDKKTRSKPMTQILDRLRAYGEFEIIIFGDRLILDTSIPVSEWPLVHALISFTSKGFPLAKVIEYVRLRKPFCVNDLPSQAVLENRYDIYAILERAGIPTPRHLYVDRVKNPNTKVEEFPDHIEIDGVRMDKPLVEKPYDGDDHNIYIYYGAKNGGGSRRLFRKIGNRSSRFYPKVNCLRTEGNYIYESLLLQGKDLKVYTIGPGYAHGEMRKSPVVDGVVARDPDQKELRLLTKLTEEEREMARGICVAFKQNICGFDIIRTAEKSYVIDVNGWSFVKGNMRYYDKCARIMRKMCLGCFKGREALKLDRTLELIHINMPPATPTPNNSSTPLLPLGAAATASLSSSSGTQVEVIHEEPSTSTPSSTPAHGGSERNQRAQADKERSDGSNSGGGGGGKDRPSSAAAHARSGSKEASKAGAAGKQNQKDKDKEKEKEKEKEREREKEKEREKEREVAEKDSSAAPDKEKDSTSSSFARKDSEATPSVLSLLSAHVPRLELEKTDATSSGDGAPIVAPTPSSALSGLNAASIAAGSSVGGGFGSFSLDNASASSSSSFASPLSSLLSSPTNPRALGVTMASNLIQDTDNNDILLGLVAMFRHADRTPKQKVKLKTKSQTLMQLFDEQYRLAEKEATQAAAAAAQAEKDAAREARGGAGGEGGHNQRSGSGSVKAKHKTKPGVDQKSGAAPATPGGGGEGKDKDRNNNKKEDKSDAGPPVLASTPASGSSSSSSSLTSATSPTSTLASSSSSSSSGSGAASVSALMKDFSFKDLKWKKKGELVGIREAIKILLVKEQLREKRKKKLKLAQQAAAAAATASAAAGEGGDTTAVDEAVASTTPVDDASVRAAAVAAAKAAAAVRAAAAAAATAEWSEDDMDLAAAATAGSPPAPPEGGNTAGGGGCGVISDSNPDEVLEALIAAEKEKELKRDSEKDPDYMSKLFQIGQVLSQGYGGIKVQLKPKKWEKNAQGIHKVTQALLIVKWGGEMTHAGVGQARQYAAAFWDDMIPPPPLPPVASSNNLAGAGGVGASAGGGGKGESNKLSITAAGHTSALASMATSNAKEEADTPKNASAGASAAADASTTATGMASTPLASATAGGKPPASARKQSGVAAKDAAAAASSAAIAAADASKANDGAAKSTAAAADAAAAAAAAAAAQAPHEFAYDYNSSLTQGDRAKLKSQLTAARSANTRASAIEPIPESSREQQPSSPQDSVVATTTPSKGPVGTKDRKHGSSNSTPPPQQQTLGGKGDSSANNTPASSPGSGSVGGTTRKLSKSGGGGSNLLSLTSAQSSGGQSGGNAGSTGRDNASGKEGGNSGAPSNLLPLLSSGGDTPHGSGSIGNFASPSSTPTNAMLAAAGGGSGGSSNALSALSSSGSGGSIGPLVVSTTPSPLTDAERLSTFRKQRLAFFAGLQMYSSDEARVVASAEAFYQSTFEHAHGLSELTVEQSREREEKKKITAIKEWIESSKKTHIAHDKEVQRFLDDTNTAADSMARAKEVVKFILMAEQALTPAQVTRHMLAQEQIARATSEAERADIMKEEEELLRLARAEAESREREEKEQAHLQRKQQLAEELMEKLMDRLAELEEDGMHLEQILADMNARIKAKIKKDDAAAAAQAVSPTGSTGSVTSPESSPVSSPAPMADEPFAIAGCLAAHAKKSDPKVISELEALLSKIYAKLLETATKKRSKDKGKADKLRDSIPMAAPLDTAAADALAAAASSASKAQAVVATGALPLLKAPPTPPSISPPPSPSSFGPDKMTEWGVRCLRWIGKPRNTLMKLYDLLLLLQVQIHSKCEFAEKHVAEQAQAQAQAAAAAAADAASEAGGAGHTPTPPHRKMSGGNLALIPPADSNSLGGGLGGGKQQAAADKPTASTEFEYVYEWEEGDEEIVGKASAQSGKIRRAAPTRFGSGYLLCHKETLFLMKARWDNLIASFYDVKADTFDPTKLPDVYDCIKYDVLHNMEFLSDIRPLYSAIKRVADFVVPNEYGILRKDKWTIGVGIARPLLGRMISKLESALSPKCPSRVTLYFSSESHIHALRNVLLLSGIACNRTVATTLDAIELNYLSHAVFRLYEDVSKPLDDPLRYYVNVQFSPGAALDPFIFSEEGHTLPVSRPVPVNGRIPFEQFKFIFGQLSEAQPHRGFVQPWVGHTQAPRVIGAAGGIAAAAAQAMMPSTPGAVSAAPSPRRQA